MNNNLTSQLAGLKRLKLSDTQKLSGLKKLMAHQAQYPLVMPVGPTSLAGQVLHHLASHWLPWAWTAALTTSLLAGGWWMIRHQPPQSSPQPPTQANQPQVKGVSQDWTSQETADQSTSAGPNSSSPTPEPTDSDRSDSPQSSPTSPTPSLSAPETPTATPPVKPNPSLEPIQLLHPASFWADSELSVEHKAALGGDTNQVTAWRSKYNGDLHYLAVKLSSPKQVHKVILHLGLPAENEPHILSDFSFEMRSADSDSWQAIPGSSVSGNQERIVIWESGQTLNLTQLRIITHDSWASIRELELWGY